MPISANERKQRYCKIILGKAKTLYFSWGRKRAISKKLVAKANEYAWNQRLKTDHAYRFYALVFAVALSLRVEKDYSNFFRKLFRICAFLRERNALKILKRMLGFDFYTDVGEMIEVEMEKLALLLFQRSDQDETGGGKHVGIMELSIEEELESFLEESEREAEQQSLDNDLQSDKANEEKSKDDPTSPKTEKTARSEEMKNPEKSSEEKQSNSQDNSKREQSKTDTAQNKADSSENKKDENSTQKSAANISILAEMMSVEQAHKQEPPSPFPIFRETNESSLTVEKNEELASKQEPNETSFANEREGNADGELGNETEQTQSPFPVFKVEQGEEPRETERPIEKESKTDKETKQRKEAEVDFDFETDTIKPVQEKPVHKGMEISEENRVRIALNSTMSLEQRLAIVAQMQMAAKEIMAQEERAWREKISVEDSANSLKVSPKSVENRQNNGAIKHDLRK